MTTFKICCVYGRGS